MPCATICAVTDRLRFEHISVCAHTTHISGLCIPESIPQSTPNTMGNRRWSSRSSTRCMDHVLKRSVELYLVRYISWGESEYSILTTRRARERASDRDMCDLHNHWERSPYIARSRYARDHTTYMHEQRGCESSALYNYITHHCHSSTVIQLRETDLKQPTTVLECRYLEGIDVFFSARYMPTRRWNVYVEF